MESKAVEVIISDPSYFYSFARRFSRDTSKISPLVEGSKDPTADPTEMAQILGRQYQSVLRNPRTTVDAQFMESVENTSMDQESALDNVEVNQALVLEAIEKVPNASAPGPDGIPPQCFKYGGPVVLRAIEDITRLSVDQGLFPDPLKDTWISPNHKGDSRLDPANYRPLALTGHLAKIMERVVCPQIVSFLEARLLMDDTQHGAKSRRSTVTQLLLQHQRLLEMLENQDNVELVF